MTVDQFWDIIHKAGERKSLDGSIAKSLREGLRQMEPDEIVLFAKTFDHYHDMADRWLLWSAANLMTGGLSDDGFHYFRSWLVGRGREVYHSVLEDPDNLARFERGPADDESAQYAASAAYDYTLGLKPCPDDFYTARDALILTSAYLAEIEDAIRLHPYVDDRIDLEEDAKRMLPLCYGKFDGANFNYNTWLHPADYHDRPFGEISQ